MLPFWLMPGLSWLGLVLALGGGGLDEDGAELVAAARQVFRGEVQSGHRGLRAGDRDAAELVGEQAADRLDVLRVDADAEQLLQVRAREAGGDPGRAGVKPLDRGALGVVLVGDLADDLLEDVLDRDEPGGAAVLVDD